MKKQFKWMPLVCALVLLCVQTVRAQDFSVIAYYTGDDKAIDRYEVDKLTHIIFSFGHLKDGLFRIDDGRDTAAIRHLVSLKQQRPQLKIMLSLGGWGGCEPCSDAFSTAGGRQRFARSVKEVNDYFGTDGIDLDWEYPAIPGHPGHPYKPEDRENFTALVAALREVLGDSNELSFAAGGFQKFLDESVEWHKVMPLVDRVNIMSYDLVHGYSTVTGHHTPLYSVRPDEESTDRAVQYLTELGISPEKLVIGAAFYCRVWQHVAPGNNGRYQPGEHTNGYHFKQYKQELTAEKGWRYHYDEQAEAPYWYNTKERKYATGDDIRSVTAKTRYAREKGLGGIMFWELTLDKERGGLLDAIATAIDNNQ
ncbi:glycoside hydrolase family 18 protein [Parapedobacter deserti]|uniref:chitinase n=2 Tax=Parapedobacter deserti TaxID=1912957 RepID=A0ABV7JE03_9SPHI